MNENLNLVEILKDCPERTKLYSPIIGEVEFKRIKYSEYPIVTCSKNVNRILLFTKEGLFFSEAECIMLFPAKINEIGVNLKLRNRSSTQRHYNHLIRCW